MTNMNDNQNGQGMAAEKSMRLNDKVALRKLREEMDKALADVAARMGLISLSTGNIRFEGDGTEAKLTVNAKAQSLDGKTTEERAFDQYHSMFGIPASALGSTITRINGQKCKIIGLCPNRRKFPVLVTGDNGKRYLITVPEVQRIVGRAS